MIPQTGVCAPCDLIELGNPKRAMPSLGSSVRPAMVTGGCGHPLTEASPPSRCRGRIGMVITTSDHLEC